MNPCNAVIFFTARRTKRAQRHADGKEKAGEDDRIAKNAKQRERDEAASRQGRATTLAQDMEIDPTYVPGSYFVRRNNSHE